MTNESRTDGQHARDDAADARRSAEAAVSAVSDIMHRLDELRVAATQIAVTQAETRADIARVEVIAREGRDQSKITNGRVTVLELWKAEAQGIAQGAGGVGRLILYMLGAATSTAGLITVAMKVLGD